MTRIGKEQDPIVVPAPPPQVPFRRELPPDTEPAREPEREKEPVKT